MNSLLWWHLLHQKFHFGLMGLYTGITWSNIAWYCIQHCNDLGRIQIRPWTDKIYPILALKLSATMITLLSSMVPQNTALMTMTIITTTLASNQIKSSLFLISTEMIFIQIQHVYTYERSTRKAGAYQAGCLDMGKKHTKDTIQLHHYHHHLHHQHQQQLHNQQSTVSTTAIHNTSITT